MNITKLQPKNNDFTAILAEIPDSPKHIFYRGQLPTTRQKTVAIVGSRKPTAYGKEIAHILAFQLAQKGIVVVSGLALGIDAIAHRGALEAGGITLAVLANGVDKIYPASHTTLGNQILRHDGAIISEYEPGVPALAFQFLARNRIVSGLADAVIVVEAAARSGTLSTASHALDQGREVFAVPGNITSPLSAGCNKLIKMGASPLTELSDVLDFLLPEASQTQLPGVLTGATDDETLILKIIQSGVRSGEEILKQSKLSASSYSQAMTMLEINGQIRALGANKWGLR